MKLKLEVLSSEITNGSGDAVASKDILIGLEFWGRGSKAGALFVTSIDGDGNAVDRALIQVTDKGKLILVRKRDDV